MQKIWNIKKADYELQNKLARSLRILPITAQLLINRQVNDVESANLFLNISPTNLYTPDKLKGIKEAVALIKKTIKSKKNIVIWGDYDVDGITSVGVLYLVLKRLGAKVDFYIPHRLREGYGLNKDGINSIKDNTALVIALDCGIDAKEEVKLLNKHGIEVIVVDHHHPKKESLPDCIIINPLQPSCSYPFKHLAAVGLSFKLSQALMEENIDEHLDLVGLGTIADVVPIIGENRILVKRGLEALSKSKKHGIRALIEVSGIANKKIKPSYVGFILAPRINASGRLASAHKSLELLLTDSRTKALELAKYLDNENRNRQKIESVILLEAIERINRSINFKDDKVIVLAGKDWHPGVLGIVASRIVERFYRPSVMLSCQDGFLRGSARSVNGFNIFDAFTRCKDYLLEYGGHSLAAGLVLEEKNLDKFTKAINTVAINLLNDKDLIPKLDVDMQINLDDITDELLDQIDVLAPFGVGNPAPIFVTSNLKVKEKPVICGKDTLKFWVESKNRICQAIGYKMGSISSLVCKGSLLDLVYQPFLDSWHDVKTITLQVKDFRSSCK